MSDKLYTIPAASYVRGVALLARDTGYIRSLDKELNGRAFQLPSALLDKPLHALTQPELETILHAGEKAGLKLYRFKNTHEELPRVKRALGFLRGMRPDRLLDVGSGRGVFLLPFLNAFPEAEVLCVDLLDYRVELWDAISRGGLTGLTALQGDICALEIADHSFDVVTMLEVLEHIPDTKRALSASLRIARQALIISVPSKPDQNPEHIHLLTKALLSELLGELGCRKLHFDAVPGHLLLVASV